MQTQKGKQGTKGQKQIYADNHDTIMFYTKMSAVAIIAHLGLNLLVFRETTETLSWFVFAMSVFVQLLSLQFMRYMAQATFSEKQQVTDAGIDLNMQGGLGEYCKDAVILTSIVQILAIISIYCWLLYLAGPFYAMYLLWTSIIAPWIFAPAPEDPEDDKKARKRDRKMKRI